MSTRKIYFFSFLMLTIATFFLLITGSPVLTISLGSNNTIPLGTFITWIGLISLPLAIYFGIKQLRKPTKKVYRILSGLLKIGIAFGIFWVPISYLLAGNLSFNFSEAATFQGGQTAMQWFWIYSYSIAIISISVVIFYWISLFWVKKKTPAE